MAVKLRLTRRGKKKQPFYRIVAADSRAPRDGKYIEKIGHYDPLTNPADIVIDDDKAVYWLKNGAIPTDTVKNLFSKNGLWMKWSLIKQGADEKKVEEELKKWEMLQLERQKKREALAAQEKREQEKLEAKEAKAKAEAEEAAAEVPEEQVEVKAEQAKPEAPDAEKEKDTAAEEETAKEE